MYSLILYYPIQNKWVKTNLFGPEFLFKLANELNDYMGGRYRNFLTQNSFNKDDLWNLSYYEVIKTGEL